MADNTGTHKGLGTTESPSFDSYKGKFRVTVTDKSDGSVMDVDRPAVAPYGAAGQIGPQTKTNFGRNRDDEKAS